MSSLIVPFQAKRQPANTAPATNTLYSFEPEVICEFEERERVTALAQRDFLIKSYGILEQIYMAMKRNGTLRPIDEKKYGLYGRLGNAENGSNGAALCRYKSHRHQHNAPGTNRSSQYSVKASRLITRILFFDGTNIATCQISVGSSSSADNTIPRYLSPIETKHSMFSLCFRRVGYQRMTLRLRTREKQSRVNAVETARVFSFLSLV